MNYRFVLAGALLAGTTLPSFATSASGLSSFEGTEEPTVVYHLSSDSFSSDSYTNLTNISGGFRATLRYRSGDWWDGDRSTSNKDRQRAEVKGLGSHQFPGDTFDYQSTWRTDSSFRQNGHFCHIFQLKALDGDNGAPLVTQSLDDGGSSGGVQYCTGNASGFTTARSFTYSAGGSKTVKIRIKTTSSGDNSGLVQASINGDTLQGTTNVAIYRPSSTEYRPKWGFYRGVGTNDNIVDDYIEHTSVSANKVTGGGGGGGGTFNGYYKIIARHSGKAVVVQSASTSDNAAVVQYTYGGSATNDEWQLIQLADGAYEFANRNSGKAMVVQSASTSDGAKIIQYSFGGSNTNDEWDIVDVGSGYYEIKNRNSGKALEVPGGSTSNSVQLDQRSYSSASYQQFQIISVP